MATLHAPTDRESQDAPIDWAAAHETNAKCRRAADPLAAFLFPATPYSDRMAEVLADCREVEAEEHLRMQADINRLCGAPVTFEPMSVERRREIEAEEEACERDDARRERNERGE